MISGKISLNARIPAAAAGLWSGAKADNSSTCSTTLSSTKADSLKYSPPATTR